MNSILIIFVFNIINCCTCNICPRAVKQATQVTTRENLSSGSLTKRVSNQSPRLNRLARKLILDMILLKKTDNKVADETARMHRLICAFIVTKHRGQVFSAAVHLLNVSFYHKRLENNMRNLIIVKHDNSEL